MGEGIERLIPLSRAGDSMLSRRLQAVLRGDACEGPYEVAEDGPCGALPRLRGRLGGSETSIVWISGGVVFRDVLLPKKQWEGWRLQRPRKRGSAPRMAGDFSFA